jgi:multidrug efflux pump subunit AcrB
MWMIGAAMRRPITVIIAVIAIALSSILAITRMKTDVFPDLDIPAIYVIQPYGGMSPSQIEGYIVSAFEVHFLYISGIRLVESRSIQNIGLVKLFFHEGTNMAQAMAQTVAMVERSRSFMPPGTIQPFVLRFDAGSLPVGQLVLSSKTRSVNEIQDLAFVRIRGAVATLPGIQAPPPFGGNARTIVISVYPEKLRSFNMSADEVVSALATGNMITPAGNVRTGNLMRIAPVNTSVENIHDLDYMPIRTGHGPTVYLRDIGHIDDSCDILTGYALADGRRTVYMPVAKRADASTLSVVSAVRKALPQMQALLPPDVKISYEFDQSRHVTEAIKGLLFEGALGAILPGIMILIFLQDPRSTLIVVTTIPCALLTAVVALWLTGQTINIQTLGGLALAIGILVDEATVNIENIHTHLARGKPMARSVFDAGCETMVPRLLAMMSVIVVFVPSFFMVGVTRALFVPLSLSVGFAMLASFLLSSTLVPVLAVWMLKHKPEEEKEGFFKKYVQKPHAQILSTLMPIRYPIMAVYLLVCFLLLIFLGTHIGTEMFPSAESDEFRIRLRAPTGTRIERSEVLTLKTLDVIKQEAGPGNVLQSLSFVGTQPPTYAISTAYLWTSGPQEAVMLVKLRKEANIELGQFKDRLRSVFKKIPELADCTFSFEPGDIVSQTLNLGADTPIEIDVRGPVMKDNRSFARIVLEQMKKIPYLKDLQYGQPQEYPTVDINVDRMLAGQLNVTTAHVANSLVPATSSSRFILENYWLDRKSGISYQVQVQYPQDRVASIEDVKNVPAMDREHMHPLVSDVADVRYGSTVGEVDRHNMQRTVSLVANYGGMDLGDVGKLVQRALKNSGEPPRGVTGEVRGQVPVLQETLEHLLIGLALALGVIYLMLTAYFQSPRLAMVVLSTAPAILAGVLVALTLSGTTLNVESFMGAIMSTGVGASNAILLVVFAEENRLAGAPALEAAIQGAESRLRPIMMTSIAMIAGMVPMALALSEGGAQSAPLGRAVIGGLFASTLSALFILPMFFGTIQAGVPVKSPSLHPEDLGQ